MRKQAGGFYYIISELLMHFLLVGAWAGVVQNYFVKPGSLGDGRENGAGGIICCELP